MLRACRGSEHVVTRDVQLHDVEHTTLEDSVVQGAGRHPWRSRTWLTTKDPFRHSMRSAISGCAPACTSAVSAMDPIPMTASTCCSRRSSTTPSMSSSWAPARRSRSSATATSSPCATYGRGIPLGKVVDCVSQINTGAKYNDDVFQFSVGLNGVGTKAVNALSKDFEVVSYRDGKYKARHLRARRSQDRQEGRAEGRSRRHLCPFRAGP